MTTTRCENVTCQFISMNYFSQNYSRNAFLRERFHYKEGCTGILKFPDDSSGERTRHVPIDKKQDDPF